MLPASFASFGSWSGACEDLQGGIQPAPPRTGGCRVVRMSDGSGGRYVLVCRCPFRSPASPASSPPSSAIFLTSSPPKTSGAISTSHPLEPDVGISVHILLLLEYRS